MKKIFSTFFVFLMITNTVNVSNITIFDKSVEALNFFLTRSIELGDTYWYGFSILNHESIVDNQLEEYGYIFNLLSDTSEGYAIVTCEDNSCSVVEASYDSPSPFKGYEETHYLVYFSPLEYLTIEKNQISKNSMLASNIETKRSIVIDASEKKRFINNNITRSVPGETVKYISQYSSKFNPINQNTSFNCVATSMAMCLKYLQNIGTIKVNIGTNSNPSAIEIRNTITGLYSAKNGYDSTVRPAINEFGTNYCSPKISTRGDGFWGNSENTDISFQTIVDEINSNCPLVMMFNPGRVDSNINVNHATACVGYKNIKNDVSGNEILNYTIVRMPNVRSDNDLSVATKQVGWSYKNVHGYYLVYIG